jgi:hypothetical protein
LRGSVEIELENLNPLGFGIIEHAAGVRSASTELISEWQPGWTEPLAIGFMIVGVGVAIHAWRGGRPFTTGAILTSVALTLTAFRFEPILVLLAIPELALIATRLTNDRPKVTKVVGVPAAVLFSIVLLPFAVSTVAQPGHPVFISVEAVDSIPSNCRTLNDAYDGGAIILLRPDVQVSQDGRNDFYGVAEYERQIDVLMNNVDSIHWLSENKVECVFADNKHPIKSVLLESAEWRTVYSDRQRSVFTTKGV